MSESGVNGGGKANSDSLGAGGNISSTKTAVSTIDYAFSGEDGTVPSDGDSTYIGGGGSSTAGVCSSRSNNNGSLLNGGGSYEKGGAGYYGGAGGRGTGKDKSGKYSAGGGGGSSFISSLATFEGLDSSVTSKVSTSNPSTTGGSLIITYIGS